MIVKGRLQLTVLSTYWLGEVPRDECVDEARPCKRDACRFHLWSEIATEQRSKPGRKGIIPRVTAAELLDKPSCAIDIAEERDDEHPDGGKTLAEVAKILGVTRVAVVHIENRAKAKLARAGLDLYDNGLPAHRSRY